MARKTPKNTKADAHDNNGAAMVAAPGKTYPFPALVGSPGPAARPPAAPSDGPPAVENRKIQATLKLGTDLRAAFEEIEATTGQTAAALMLQAVVRLYADYRANGNELVIRSLRVLP